MQTLARLFGRSPFAPLQTHMEKVAICVKKMLPLFDALGKKDYELVASISKEICRLEHEADLTKNEIRNNLPTALFLPIARASLLEILALQDNIADRMEDTAVLLTFKNLEILPSFEVEFRSFLMQNLETFEGVYKIIKEMGQLLESSFGGKEAEKVRKMVDEVAFKERECDIVQRALLKKMFQDCDTLSGPAFFLWMKVIQELASLSDESEKLANRVRMTLEVK
ncbi:MAG: TIGR00153 family protein [Chlamydiales bacterium]|nr:TIGR00153 family protein [Chlamydiales bacterium]